MGVEQTSIAEVPQKVRSWINCLPENLSRSLMEGTDSDCSRCLRCGCLSCDNCVLVRCGSPECYGLHDNGFEKGGEEKSSLLSLERMDESTGRVQSRSKMEQFAEQLQLSRRTLQYSFSSPRSMDYEDEEYSSTSFFTPSSSFSLATTSDSESTTLTELPSFKSRISSPQNSPRRSPEPSGDATPTSRRRTGPFDPYSPSYSRQSSYSESVPDLINNQIFNDYELSRRTPPPLNLEGNSLIWLPPPAADEGDDTENGFYELDEDEDSNNGFFADSGYDEDGLEFGEDGNSNLTQKEVLKDALHGHFRALVAQLLEGQGVDIGNESSRDSWLEIVASLTWQAANFVKPNTQRGGSMDPANYVKVKCVASGTPGDSIFVKGVVCSKNVKHKRMVSQHRDPRLVLLGGALEYQKTPNKLASLDTVLEQEKEHLKRIVAAIEAHQPNVLLVEKSASLYAQEILSKDISLVLNVKPSLLERISRCTGARIAASTEYLSSARIGHCRTFRTEKVTTESLGESNVVGRKTVKTLMFFDGCPKRLGCTILLRGGSLEELKKVKHAAQFAVFAAYHLSLETSFLADEGASLPRLIAFDSTGQNLTNGSLNGHLLTQDQDQKESDSSPRSQSGQDESREDSTMEEKSDNEQMRVYGPEDQREMMTTDIFSTDENQQSILVSVSSTYAVKGSGTVCEQSQLFRIKFYGGFDKPLGRYLREDLFGQDPYCSSCNELTENHVKCYTHQQGTLTISVKRLSSDAKLPGERDGKIWMWHRCLMCPFVKGVPPATPRVVMSNAAWGLSFGKFLELSFSNHTTANRVASCGHSLQRDCLRFYGFGSMVAVFRYSPVDILSVNLPPSVMDFTNRVPLEWVREQTAEICSRADCLYAEVSHVLNTIEKTASASQNELLKESIVKEISDLREVIRSEKVKYDLSLSLVTSESVDLCQPPLDVFELNRLRRGLLNDAYGWDRRLSILDDLAKGRPVRSDDSSRGQEGNISPRVLECNTNNIVEMDLSIISPEGYVGSAGLNLVSGQCTQQEESQVVGSSTETFGESLVSSTSSLSDRIDMAWTGSAEQLLADSFGSFNLMDNPAIRKRMAPLRVHSFDSAFNSVNTSKDQLVNIRRALSQKPPKVDDVSNMAITQPTMHILPASCMVMGEGARVAMLSHADSCDVVITIHDDELTSIVASAMTSQEYYTFISPVSDHDRTASLSEETHFRLSFDDDASSPADKGRYAVTCYYAKQFDALRKVCCPCEMDFIRSISRCKKWSANGGKSNAYFAKTLDERFIVKQVTRTELYSFEDFAAEYFRYLMESLKTGSPTCLAKVVGLYQVVAKNVKGREIKMDFMVMENLFFGRDISRIYDLKGSLRSRYNHDTSGSNKVLLDLNLLENLHTKPIFLGFKAKRRLERAVWNDTSFLASVDVMDYSLLVGIDEEKKELVIGIIDYLRQYTWDKQLETWVKTSGLLGGPKNTLPTVISPSQYKKRFRKAMSKYFLTLPDQWSC